MSTYKVTLPGGSFDIEADRFEIAAMNDSTEGARFYIDVYQIGGTKYPELVAYVRNPSAIRRIEKEGS